ncbi:hypothetical protein EX895_001528 [Sporisorium graminicola]|uniref:Uncharacterized protein n=1 Tax=Sporisorium graminicola TaxID=280036 RepID=A0A4U7KYD4_9BASI|nr:hypothetical protein EX895_001528 [Sporisorium graminicola]TKY89743.1 hypothetical protein EX895_001528 [Sporisorium graminicola]
MASHLLSAALGVIDPAWSNMLIKISYDPISATMHHRDLALALKLTFQPNVSPDAITTPLDSIVFVGIKFGSHTVTIAILETQA